MTLLINSHRFNEEDFDNGYSRNLLWRLWHASWAFEMEHLSEKCGKVNIELPFI